MKIKSAWTPQVVISLMIKSSFRWQHRAELFFETRAKLCGQREI